MWSMMEESDQEVFHLNQGLWGVSLHVFGQGGKKKPGEDASSSISLQ